MVAEFFRCGYEAVVLSRSGKSQAGARGVAWDANNLGAWTSELEGADTVVNLCGESLMQRWTPSSKAKFGQSRAGVTRLIGEAVSACKEPPRHWINASAVGWYGDTGNREVSEASPCSNTLAGLLCRDWEAAVDAAITQQTTKTKLRIGLVLSPGCVFFDRMKQLTAMRLGGPMGSGKQYVSWIHGQDLARLAVWTAENRIGGAVNATSPGPCMNAKLMAAFRKAVGVGFGAPLPGFAAKALCAAMNWELPFILGGTKAVPAIALGRGFVFDHVDIDLALQDLIRDIPPAWLGSIAA